MTSQLFSSIIWLTGSYPVLHSSLALGLEMKMLIVATCHSIVKLENSLTNLDAKSATLEQHRSPKDLLLLRKKLWFENEQPKVDEILLTETLAHRKVVEVELLKTLESSHDSQLKIIAPENEEEISIVKQRFAFNVSSFYSQLAISRENSFTNSRRAAEKVDAKKKADDLAMDTSPDARVVNVLDQRLKQLGLIGKKSKSSQSPSRSSLHVSRGASRSSLKLRKKSSKKSVKFDPLVQHQQMSKTVVPPLHHIRREEEGVKVECYLLSLGLKFRPTPHVLSIDVLNKQLDDFVRSVGIKYFFVTMFPCTHNNFTSCLLNLTGILHNVLHGLKFHCQLLDLSCFLCLIVNIYMYHLTRLILNFLP